MNALNLNILINYRMHHHLFLIPIIFIFIILSSIKKYTNNKLLDNTSEQSNYFECQKNALLNCQIPTVSQKNCYLSKYYKCPKVNGTYLQCTNNYWSYDNVCKCENRTFEMCPYPYKIDGVCYQKKLKRCPPPTNKERNIIYEPCQNPRINMYHSGNKEYRNINFAN